jgi:DNA-binding GntR family transcriptional regulator
MAGDKAVAHIYAQRTELGRGVIAVTTDANARLIAAAPELLEALQKLVEKADDSDDAQYGTLSTSFVRDLARAAIKKAETP